jgi:SlyX protein
MSSELAERVEDLEVKLAFQDQLIRELDALVRQFGDRLDAMDREFKQLKQAVQSPEPSLGPANEPPPHY